MILTLCFVAFFFVVGFITMLYGIFGNNLSTIVIGILFIIGSIVMATDSQSLMKEYYETHNLKQCIIK